MPRIEIIAFSRPARSVRLGELLGTLATNRIRSVSTKLYGDTALFTFGSFIDAWHAMFILRSEDAHFEVWENDPPRLAVSLK